MLTNVRVYVWYIQDYKHRKVHHLGALVEDVGT